MSGAGIVPATFDSPLYRFPRGSWHADPNVWFEKVEVVAAERIGRETVQYVSNIDKYYIAYTLITEDLEERKKTMGELKKEAQ